MTKGSALKTKAQRELARRLYVEEGLHDQLIGERMGLSEASIARYRADDKKGGISWSDLRLAKIVGRGQTDENFRLAVLALSTSTLKTIESVEASTELDVAKKADLLRSLADSFAKTVSSTRKYQPEVAIEVIVSELLGIVAAELTGRDPHAAQVFLDSLEAIKSEVVRRQSQWQN